MPVIMNWAANLLLGGATAQAVQNAPGLYQGRMPWPLLWLCTLQAVLLTPIATYHFRFFPDWSMFYWLEPAATPWLEASIGLLAALAVSGNFASMWLGFTCTRRSLTMKKPLWRQAATGLGLATLAACLTWLGDRVAYAGDYETFWQGQAPCVARCACGWLGLVQWSAAAAFVMTLQRRYAACDPKWF